MLHRNRVIAGLLAVGLLGCGKSAPDAADTAPAPPPSARADAETPADAGAVPPTEGQANAGGAALAPVAPPTVTLLDAGVEPRTPLRLKLTAGAVEETTVAMRMGVEMTLDGQAVPRGAMPSARLDLRAKVDAVDGDKARWSVTITEARVDDSGGTPVAMLGQLKEGLAAVKGLTASGEVSDRGVTTLAGFAGTAPEGQMATLLEGFRESLVQLAVPLPEEPVGVGARWQVEQVVPQGGMRIRQTTVFDVVSVEGERVVARVTMTQAAEPGGEAPASLPPGARLEAFSGSGTGDTTLALGRILPASSAATVATRVKMTVPGPDGAARAMVMAMDIRLALGEAADAPTEDEPAPAPEPEPEDAGEDESAPEADGAATEGGGE
ncbi:MAG: hypothetical protein EP329_12690 [Deltaproteobacteria bacterium]|nr:MAG: hypothetical protein EP329_12690 [Deltaproteobacteria bacterium]